jgi:hypothetical protein
MHASHDSDPELYTTFMLMGRFTATTATSTVASSTLPSNVQPGREYTPPRGTARAEYTVDVWQLAMTLSSGKLIMTPAGDQESAYQPNVTNR